jgi:hypothetical protein
LRVLKIEVFRPGRTRGAIARFDVQVDDRIALRHMLLSIGANGDVRVFPPSIRGANSNAAWLSLELSHQITATAVAAYRLNGGQLPNEDHSNKL